MSKYQIRTDIQSIDAFHVGIDPIPEWFSTYKGGNQYVYDQSGHLCEIIFKDTHGATITAFRDEDMIYRTSSGCLSKINTDVFKRVFEEEPADKFPQFGDFARHIAALTRRLDELPSQKSTDELKLQLLELANVYNGLTVIVGEEDTNYMSKRHKRFIKISYVPSDDSAVYLDTRYVDLPDNMLCNLVPGPRRYIYED